ncbi:MAG: helix-turn-helix domain-containing protein [Kaistella sp.]
MINQTNQNEQWKLLVLLLKEFANQKSLTQNDLAELTGMQQSAISRFFLLKFKPRLDIFLLIANAVGVNFFFEDKNSESELNIDFEKAMTTIGRRPENLPKN